MPKKRIGELLVERGAISAAQLEEGLSFHRQTGQRLGVALIQKGFLTEEQLAKVLADALGLWEVDLKRVQADWSAVHMLRARFCESNDLFPFSIETPRGGRKQLLVAMSDPLNLPAIEEIEFTTGLKVVPRVAPLSGIRAAILRHYHKVAAADPNEPEGTMTIIQGGNAPRVVDVVTGEVRIPPEEEVIVGEEVREVTERTSLADLIKKREEQHRQRRADPSNTLSKDLDYLFGVKAEGEPVEALERKFWALMRLMAKKGLISRDEFTQELDQD